MLRPTRKCPWCKKFSEWKESDAARAEKAEKIITQEHEAREKAERDQYEMHEAGEALALAVYERAPEDPSALHLFEAAHQYIVELRDRAEKAEKERDEATARAELLQDALVTPAFPDDDDLDFMDRMPERSSGGKAGEEAWWKDIAEQAGYRGCMKALIGIWEVGRSETKLVKDALVGFPRMKPRHTE